MAISDQIHSALEVAGVQSTGGTASVNGQLVTVPVEQGLPEETRTITIRVVALIPERVSHVTTATTPGGENTVPAHEVVSAPGEEEQFVPEAGSPLLLGEVCSP